MEKTGIIIGGGDLTPAFAEKIIRESGSRGSLCIAAADAGLEILDRIGVAPDILLGDFDTVKQDVLGIYTDRKDVEIIRHNPVKDASDMELTADVLLERGIRRVLVLGALGGRADHTMANLLLIYRMRRKGAAEATLYVPYCAKIGGKTSSRTAKTASCEAKAISMSSW